MGKFIIKKRSNGENIFNFHAGNGQVFLSSKGYETIEGWKNGILSVKANSHLHGRYEQLQSAEV
ncbi:hypothetical protein DYBT9623_00691 [Dyadobacter sp. CECT 9623]|uniref:DUF1508 domain-containing protein n=1 Tax=Dyadobacter linearis TaxID=2823330 RepID=A0ABN7R213_9BACT|nr:hypothetical protein DYBT9623_00691 [Dyadobacter sp. CECT 9623]